MHRDVPCRVLITNSNISLNHFESDNESIYSQSSNISISQHYQHPAKSSLAVFFFYVHRWRDFLERRKNYATKEPTLWLIVNIFHFVRFLFFHSIVHLSFSAHRCLVRLFRCQFGVIIQITFYSANIIENNNIYHVII